jgi:hypothetical protein
MDEAYYELESIHSQGGRVSRSAMNLIVRACAGARDLERALATYEAFGKFNLLPDLNTLHGLLDACRARASYLGAFRLLDQFRALGVLGTQTSYEMLICMPLEVIR